MKRPSSSAVRIVRSSFAGTDHLVERARRMADLQPQIPQRIELRLDHLFGPARLLERGQEADIDIAVRRHFAATIAADRNQRDPLARRAVGRGVEMAGGEIMAEADDLIDEEGGRVRRDPPGRGVREQPALDLGTALFERPLSSSTIARRRWPVSFVSPAISSSCPDSARRSMIARRWSRLSNRSLTSRPPSTA